MFLIRELFCNEQNIPGTFITFLILFLYRHLHSKNYFNATSHSASQPASQPTPTTTIVFNYIFPFLCGSLTTIVNYTIQNSLNDHSLICKWCRSLKGFLPKLSLLVMKHTSYDKWTNYIWQISIEIIINRFVLFSLFFLAGAKSLMKWNEYNYHAQFMVE